MARHFVDRLLVTSLALAAAGMLTCVAPLLDVFFPRGSLMAFIGWMFAAGIAIVAIMVCFAWTFEKVDARSVVPQRHQERHADEWPRAVTSDGRPAVQLDRTPHPATLLVSPQLHYYPLTLCGAIPPTGHRNSCATARSVVVWSRTEVSTTLISI